MDFPRTARWLMPVVFVLLIASASCGAATADSDSEQSDVEPSPTYQVVQVTAVPSPTITPIPSPATPVVVERTDDERAVLSVWDSKLEIVFGEQWERFREDCPPGFRDDVRSPVEIEEDYGAFLARGGLMFERMSYGEPEIIVIGGSTAVVNYAVLKDGEEFGQWATFYTKSKDGMWYRNCS